MEVDLNKNYIDLLNNMVICSFVRSMTSSEGRSGLRPRSLEAAMHDRVMVGQRRLSMAAVGVRTTINPSQHAAMSGLRCSSAALRRGGPLNSPRSTLQSLPGSAWTPLSSLSFPLLSSSIPTPASACISDCRMEEAVHIGSIDVHDSQCIPETQSREEADRHGHVLAPVEQ
jgi:hypothetical protein